MYIWESFIPRKNKLILVTKRRNVPNTFNFKCNLLRIPSRTINITYYDNLPIKIQTNVLPLSFKSIVLSIYYCKSIGNLNGSVEDRI